MENNWKITEKKIFLQFFLFLLLCMSFFANLNKKKLPQPQKKTQTTIYIYGIENSGKTTFVNFLKSIDQKNNSITPTYGYDTTKISYKTTDIIFNDIGGQNCFRKYLDVLIECNTCLVYVVDGLTLNRESKVKEYEKVITNDLNYFLDRGVKVFIFVNKTDLLEDSPNKLDFVYKDEIYIKSGSAIDGKGVEEFMDVVLESIQNK